MILIQDSVRNNLPKWTENAVKGGYARGAVLSPFSSPIANTGYKISFDAVVSRIKKAGGEVWFDPTTHALQMPGVGDFRYYGLWDLWDSARGDLSTPDLCRSHIRKVFAIQRQYKLPLLAPTILMHGVQGPTVDQVIDLARIAREEAADAPFWLPVVGDSHFWSGGSELDALVGALDQFAPAGWILSVARPQSVVPPLVEASEVSGLLRTTYALSMNAEVVIGHGDLAGVSALAVNARSIGSGWDVRQRVLAYPDYAERADPDSGGGSWYQRPTLKLLYGNLQGGDYATLRVQDVSRANRLTIGSVATGPENAFSHHARVLRDIQQDLAPLTTRERVATLIQNYENALSEWDHVVRITGAAVGGKEWVSELLAGLKQFQAQEGW